MNCTTPTRLPRPSIRKREAEGGRRLALAGAGMDDQQALLDRLVRDLGVLHGLALRHLGAVALGLGRRRRSCSWLSLYDHRQSGDQKDHAVGARRDPLVEPALQIAKAPRHRVVRHDAETRPRWRPARRRLARGQRRFEACVSASMSRSSNIRLLSHSVRQSTSTVADAGAPAIAPARSSGASMVCHCPPRRPRCSAIRARHLGVERLRGRHVDPWRRRRHDELSA